MGLYLIFVYVNIINAYYPDNVCCNENARCIQLSESDYPKYCPPTVATHAVSHIVTHKAINTLNPISSNSSMLGTISTTCSQYSHCVGGYDPSCPALNTCVDAPNDSVEDNNCHSFDNCVGAAGVDCDGITLANLIDIQQPDPCTESTDPSCVKMQVSVGSIYHDLCCRQHPGGAFCDNSNYQYGQALGNGDEGCACLLEFRKAIRNYVQGYYWRQEFSNEPSTSDLTELSVADTRSTWFPMSINVLSSNWVEAKSNRLPREVAGTRMLCAPRGTKLDCPIEGDCEVNCFGGVGCIACATDNYDWKCKNRHRNRWESSYETAGDAKFCCSEKFAYVKWTGLTKTGFGRCA